MGCTAINKQAGWGVGVFKKNHMLHLKKYSYVALMTCTCERRIFKILKNGQTPDNITVTLS